MGDHCGLGFAKAFARACMKIDIEQDLTELMYLEQVRELTGNRERELLKPVGSRTDKYAKWPFELLRIIEPITKQQHKEHFAKSYPETTEASKAAEAYQTVRQDRASTHKSKGSVDKRQPR